MAKEMAEAVKPTELDEAKAKIEELSAKVTELTEAKETSEKTIAELTEAKKALEAENSVSKSGVCKGPKYFSYKGVTLYKLKNSFLKNKE